MAQDHRASGEACLQSKSAIHVHIARVIELEPNRSLNFILAAEILPASGLVIADLGNQPLWGYPAP